MCQHDKSNKNTWYANWFNSPYYHVLYKTRNDDEAQDFIEHLIKKINIPLDAKILDLACGKGRHAIYLNKMGFDVSGIDISPTNIANASQHCNKRLQFEVHDMQMPYKENYFDYVLNLFTSFGYFENPAENISVLKNINRNLCDNGILLIDFMNVHTLTNTLVEEEHKNLDGISFQIKRFIENQYVVKKINITDQSKKCTYEERVQLLSLDDFEKYLNITGFKIVNLFGDYKMDNFSPQLSPRLILLANKIHSL